MKEIGAGIFLIAGLAIGLRALPAQSANSKADESKYVGTYYHQTVDENEALIVFPNHLFCSSHGIDADTDSVTAGRVEAGSWWDRI